MALSAGAPGNVKIRCDTLLLVLSRLETQQFNVGLHESDTYENYAMQQIQLCNHWLNFFQIHQEKSIVHELSSSAQ